MELIVRAKPIHFRIISGGMECSSIEDLLLHFDRKNVSDTINDGRLTKWLRNIKENDIADKISEIHYVDLFNRKDLLTVIGILTNEDFSEIESDIQLVETLDSGISRELAISIIKDNLSTDESILMYAFNKHRELIDDVKRAFSIFERSDNQELMWIYANALIVNGTVKEKQKGINIAEALASVGYEQACAYIRNNKNKIETVKNNGISDLVRSFIGNSPQEWKSKREIIQKRLSREIKAESYTPAEKEALQLCIFMTKCLNCVNMHQLQTTLLSNKKTFGHLQKVFEFFNIYTTEINGWEIAKKRYKALAFKPASVRAIELSRKRPRDIIPTNTASIRMPINPDPGEYITFMHGFLTNVSDFL